MSWVLFWQLMILIPWVAIWAFIVKVGKSK